MKEYTKPTVSQVQLMNDQAVLGACKTSGAYAGGPVGVSVDCDHGMPGSKNDCMIAGS